MVMFSGDEIGHWEDNWPPPASLGDLPSDPEDWQLRRAGRCIQCMEPVEEPGDDFCSECAEELD